MFIIVNTLDGEILVNSEVIKRVVPAVGNSESCIMHLTEKDTIVVRHSVKEMKFKLSDKTDVLYEKMTEPYNNYVDPKSNIMPVNNLITEEETTIKKSPGRPKNV